jgi:hypothetical protein
MTLREFELVSLDDHLREAPAGQTLTLDWGLFTCRGQISAPASDLFAASDPLNERLRGRFDALLARARGATFGDLVLHDVHVTGPRGLVIDRRRRQILTGHCLGWTPKSVAMDVVDLLDGQMTEDGTALLPDLLFDRPKSARHKPGRPHSWRSDPTRKEMPASHPGLELVMAPGFTIYGHWLIDVLPRLLRIEQDRRAPLLMPHPPAFASQLLDPFVSDPEPWVRSYPGSVVYAEELWVRTQPKFDHVLDRPTAQHTWGRLREALSAIGPGRDSAELIFVSRAKWPTGRSLVNHAEVAAHLAARGYLVLHPQDLTIAEQAGLFARARHVIGEDGSGLHNIVYAQEPTTLSVVDLERNNPYQAAVANAAGHRVAHLEARQEGDAWVLHLDALDRHLDAVLGAS